MSFGIWDPKERTCYVCWRLVGKVGVCRCGSVVTFRGDHPRVQAWEYGIEEPPPVEPVE